MIIPKGIMKILLDTMDKKHVQPNCKSIHVFSSGYLSATDGHVAFVSNKLNMEDTNVKEDIMISVGTVGMTGVDYFVLDTQNNCLVCYDKENQMISMIPYTKEPHKPFEFKHIYNKHVPNTSGSITFDPKYMKRLATVFPDNSDVYLKVGQEGTPSIAIGDQGALIIMPKHEHPRELPPILLS